MERAHLEPTRRCTHGCTPEGDNRFVRCFTLTELNLSVCCGALVEANGSTSATRPNGTEAQVITHPRATSLIVIRDPIPSPSSSHNTQVSSDPTVPKDPCPHPSDGTEHRSRLHGACSSVRLYGISGLSSYCSSSLLIVALFALTSGSNASSEVTLPL